MDLNSPDTWQWIWLVMAVVFVVAELSTPATFFFLPFAIGAVVGAFTAFIGMSTSWEWTIFFLVSAVLFLGLWPLGRRLERADGDQEGVGATRWVGQQAHVTEAIAMNGYGTVRLEREVWRAESMTGDPIRVGSTVLVTRLAGTRLVVVPVDEPPDSLSGMQFDQGGSGPASTQGAN